MNFIARTLCEGPVAARSATTRVLHGLHGIAQHVCSTAFATEHTLLTTDREYRLARGKGTHTLCMSGASCVYSLLSHASRRRCVSACAWSLVHAHVAPGARTRSAQAERRVCTGVFAAFVVHLQWSATQMIVAG